MLQVLSYSLVPFPVLNTGHLPRPSLCLLPSACHVFDLRRGQRSEELIWPTATTGSFRSSSSPACLPAPPAAAAEPPALLFSARQQHRPPPPAKRAPFHSPKSLNKKSRKQPRSTTGLPQVRSPESGPKPTQQLPGRLPSQVCVFLVTFLASLCLVNSP